MLNFLETDSLSEKGNTINYRWDISEAASGYDQAAQFVHPRYTRIQNIILDLLPVAADEPFLVVDAGGGSGRLLERLLERFRNAYAINVDQSEPFLGLAERRLERFAERVACYRCPLQEDWFGLLDQAPSVIVSMSAIHHLDSVEKHELYRRCFEALAEGGVFVNGDEVRPDSDQEYLLRMEDWADHMRRVMHDGLVPVSMHATLHGWIERNVVNFGRQKSSGDDCHETLDHQIGSLVEHGFTKVAVNWQEWMWAVFSGRKPGGSS